jgi:hypothetical protein
MMLVLYGAVERATGDQNGIMCEKQFRNYEGYVLSVSMRSRYYNPVQNGSVAEIMLPWKESEADTPIGLCFENTS